MGLLLSSFLFERRTFLSPRPYFWLVSLFDPLAVSSSRPAIGSVTPRADAVKDGRHWAVSQCSAVARPLLDGVEHGVTLRGSGRCPTTRRSESSLPVVAPSRHNLVFGGSSKTSSSRIRTMMQPCASAARLLEGGPILSLGMKAMGGGGSPPTRIVLAFASRRRNAEPVKPCVGSYVVSANWSYRRPQPGARPHCAGPHVTPQRDHPLTSQGHDHGFADSLSGTRRPRPIPLRQGTLLLEHQTAPRQLAHAPTHPGVARPGQPLFPSFAPALVRCAGHSAVAPDRLVVPQLAREHFMHQHVRRLGTNAQHLGQHQPHRMRPAPRRLLQPLQPRLLV